MKTAVATVAAVLFVWGAAGAAPAPEISGQWHGQISRGGGLTDYYFTFKAEGAKLTGTVNYPQGDYAYRMEIIDGKITGDQIAFAVLNRPMGRTGEPGAEVRWTFTGTVQGNEIAMTLERPARQAPGAPAAPAGVDRAEFTATRSTLLVGR